MKIIDGMLDNDNFEDHVSSTSWFSLMFSFSVSKTTDPF